METFGSSSAAVVHADAPADVSDNCTISPMLKLKRSSASFSSASDSSVHGGGNFFAFALSQTSSPLGRHPPALDQPESTATQHLQEEHHHHRAPPRESDITLLQSPNDIMQQIHDQNLDAAAEALASFSMMGGVMKPSERIDWQQGAWNATAPPLRPSGGFMASPRAQSWPPVGHLH